MACVHYCSFCTGKGKKNGPLHDKRREETGLLPINKKAGEKCPKNEKRASAKLLQRPDSKNQEILL